MKIYKRKNKNGISSSKYSYDFYIKGRRYRGSCYTSKKTEAIDYAEKVRRNIIDKVVFNVKNPTFIELLDFFVKNNSSYLNSIERKGKYQFKLTSKLAEVFFQNIDFNKENISKFMLEIKNTRVNRKNEPISDRTLLKYIDPLKAICKFAYSHNEITENPFDKIDLKQINKSQRAIRVRFLSKEEYKDLKEVLKDSSINDYFEFAINTGLRQGEQLDLSWDRVDFENKTIYIDKTKTDKPRTVLLTDITLKILEKRYKENLTKPFPFAKGKLHYIWTEVIKKAGVENFVWHDLRHTFASWSVKGWHDWLDKPMQLYRLKEWLGHADIKMTLKYAHLCVDDLRTDIKNNI